MGTVASIGARADGAATQEPSDQNRDGDLSWPFTPSSLIVWQSLRESARIYPLMA